MAKLSRVEKILKSSKTKTVELGSNKILDIMQDCAAVQRIETKLGSLSYTAAFNPKQIKEMNKEYDKLDKILVKYGLPKSVDDDN